MTWDHRKGDAMNEDASNPTAADERPRLIIIGLIVWIILQVPRLIAIPLIQGVLDFGPVRNALDEVAGP
jgi:hypothetical protein